MGALDLPLGMIAMGWGRPRGRTYDPHYGYQITCRGCGENYLKWGHTKEGWRLFEPFGVQHKCKKGRYAQVENQEAEGWEGLSGQDEAEEDGEMQCSYHELGPNLRLVWDLLESRTDLGDVEIASFVQELKIRANLNGT